MKEPLRNASNDETGLLQKAQTHLAAGRYQDSVQVFKELLEQSDKPDYRQQLAQCYLQWSLKTASKAQFREAGILWEQYANWAEAPLAAQDKYIFWLLASGDYAKVYAAVGQLSPSQLDSDYPELAVVLGFLLVSGQTEIAKHLPQDSAFFRHWHIVQDVLDAYRCDDVELCTRNLKMLPFRSAFRDFGTLLKSQLVVATSTEQAKTPLSKISTSSPYRPVADAALAYLQHGATFVAAVSRLEADQRHLIGRARNLSANQMELIETVSEQGGWQADRVRFNTALQFRSLFGAEDAQAFCLGMLEHYPDGLRDYLNYFGVKDDFEENRIRALLCEKAKNSYEAQHYWRRCIELLQANGTENHKKIALILRHMADSVSRAEAVELLVEALDYDPDHRDSYLRMLAYFGQEKPNSGKYETWLERSLERFPEDTEILINAAKIAVQRKAHKQALAYAQALLNIDPANRQAKQLLFDDHLVQVRRLIRSGQFETAENEIQAAEQMAADKHRIAQAELLRGSFVWLAQDRQQGLERVRKALAKLNGDPVNMQFQASMEAYLLNQSCPMAFPIDDYLLSDQQLKRLIELIGHYDEQIVDRKLLFHALDHIKVPLRNSIERLRDHDALLLSWCEALEGIGHFGLLSHCAGLVDAKSQKPIWLYYQTLVACQGDAGRLDHVTLFTLQNAMVSARNKNESKAVLLISRLIEQHQVASNPFAFADDSVENGDGPEDEDLYEALFSHLSADVMESLEQRVQDIMLETDPEQFTEKTIRQHRSTIDPQTSSALFQNPDFFASACLLVAAKALQIEIGVSFEDVVSRFEHTLS